MGKGSKFEPDNRFRQTRGQKDRSQYGYPSEVVGEIEGLLGGEEKIRQEVIPEISDYCPFPVVNDRRRRWQVEWPARETDRFRADVGFDLHDLPPILVKTFHTTPEATASKLSVPACAIFSAFRASPGSMPAPSCCRASHAPSLKSHPDRPRRQASFPCQQSGISNANTCLQTS